MTTDITYNLRDNGGRRSGIERRRFNYSGHFPERRSGNERRCGNDRRSGGERRSGWTRGNVVELKRHVDVEDIPDRRSGADRRDFTIL